jgi:ribosomal protein L7/L12
MAKVTKTRWIIAGSMLFLYIVLMVMWARGLVSNMVGSGCGWVIMGLCALLSRPFPSLPRWPQLVWGLGYCLTGVGWIGMGVGNDILSTVSVPLGSVMFLVGLVALAISTQNPDPKLPLVLSERMRAKAGLPDVTDEQGPALQVVLTDPGPNRGKVGRRLIKLYDIAGTPRLKSILRLAPVVLQTTTSRREANFIAIKLAECGAQVDIIGCAGRTGDQASEAGSRPAPLTLTKTMRARAGLSDAADERGALLQVVLVDPGPKHVRVTRRLRILYGLGLERAYALVKQFPSVLQTTTSRQEADFVAAQLSACGAEVDIVRAPV